MSTEADLQEHYEPAPDTGLLACPNCGFEIPDSLVICWKCGQRLKK